MFHKDRGENSLSDDYFYEICINFKQKGEKLWDYGLPELY